MKIIKRKIIIKNRAQCTKCQDIIESKEAYDFIQCSCKSICVDGGHDYIRRLGDPKKLIEMCEYENDT